MSNISDIIPRASSLQALGSYGENDDEDQEGLEQDTETQHDINNISGLFTAFNQGWAFYTWIITLFLR